MTAFSNYPTKLAGFHLSLTFMIGQRATPTLFPLVRQANDFSTNFKAMLQEKL